MSFPAESLALLALSLLLVIALRLHARRRHSPRNPILIDGSNVMYWRGGGPELAPLRDVIAYLARDGFTPGVIFDANAGYLLGGKYQHDGMLARQLGLPEDRVMVVPKGTPADPYLLKIARDLKARIVTNDRYRDWAQDYPEVTKPGHLIKGGYRKGRLWLDLAS